MAGAWEDFGRAGDIGDDRASSCSAEVRAYTAIELSRTGATALGDDYFSNNAGGHRDVFASPVRRAQGDDLEFAEHIGCGGDSYCYLSIFSTNARRQA